MSDYDERKRKSELAAENHIGFYDDCTYVSRKKFEDIIFFPNLKWIFHVYQNGYYETSSYGTPYPTNGYECIDYNGNRIQFEYCGIKVMDISQHTDFIGGNQPGLYYFMTALFFDATETPKEKRLNFSDIHKALAEIKILCEELSVCKTWKVYDILQENKLLHKRVAELEEELKSSTDEENL